MTMQLFVHIYDKCYVKCSNWEFYKFPLMVNWILVYYSELNTILFYSMLCKMLQETMVHMVPVFTLTCKLVAYKSFYQISRWQIY